VGAGDDDLKCDGPPERRLPGLEHQAHAAAPHQLADLLAIDHRQRRWLGDRLVPGDRGQVHNGVQALAPGQTVAQQCLELGVVRTELLRGQRLVLLAQLLPSHQ